MSYFSPGDIGIEFLREQKKRTLTIKAQWLLYVPPGLALRTSKFCPQSAFICFVWISEQRLFPYKTTSDWFYNRKGMCLLRGTH
jgi:hypothetical protein